MIESLIDPPQSLNDGKLDIYSFSSVCGLVSELSCKGHANRLAQSSGPILIDFNANQEEPVYINIDGEYFKVLKPSKAKVERIVTIRMLTKA